MQCGAGEMFICLGTGIKGISGGGGLGMGVAAVREDRGAAAWRVRDVKRQ